MDARPTTRRGRAGSLRSAPGQGEVDGGARAAAAAAAAGAYGDRAPDTWVAEMTAKGDDDRPMFWMAEWGAPFEVYCRIMQLFRTYADAAQDHVSRSSACDGFSTWLRRAVMGEPVEYANSSAYVPLDRSLVLVRLHPNRLAWYGNVVDHLLFLARITLDYARWAVFSLSRPEYEALLDTARRFARYALRLLVPCAELVIHELGHIYAGGGHCDWAKYPSTNDCCFGMAGARITCFVTQALGLPPNEVEGPYVGSPTGRLTDTLWECMFDTTVLLACRVQCDVLDPGAIGAGAHLCISPCAGPAHYRCEVLS